MWTTASYELFPDAPSERVMARARYLAREGRVGDAEKAYRDVLAAHPDLKSCWAECFELLRSHGRREEALHLAEGARAQFGDSAFPLTLKGAAQATEHTEQRLGAEREIAITRRYAFYAPRRPEDLSPAERWFAETGTVVLAPDLGADVPDDAALVTAFLDLARDSRWRFGQVVTLGPALPVWQALADGLGAPLVGRAGFDAAAVPLVVAQRALSGDAGWSALQAAVARDGTGLVFVLEHAVDDAAAAPGAADVIGVL